MTIEAPANSTFVINCASEQDAITLLADLEAAGSLANFDTHTRNGADITLFRVLRIVDIDGELDMYRV